ncbi:probable SUP35 - eukaryotic peptide chain release factor GTP-binding subunit [Melanopsichium pennsylvanicum]|uniref:Eukaryotic peptide chain release factor GTP-binding subunit n=2 Tax=Melanopsichium pennsylvanicum TaxID=63383 RepID=A0AAJ4XS04_9BASI|nr:probable SUP35-eukaryotic peptide chain release factor GTP-binding subunit [Melanopsichium pennsylvanicum 4]SNX86816.1 probable SUP35 - eukaryotic peptide chain release factor GTP-binding subunit [Melanopsichium pennsylvanicum]
MNPNAPSFGFNPNASGFVPGGQGQQGQQQQGGNPYAQQGGYYQQGFNNQQGQQQGFTGGYPNQPYQQYQQQPYGGGYAQQGFNHQAFNNQYQQHGLNGLPARPAASGSSQPPPRAAQPAAAASTPVVSLADAAPRKPVSISIGGGTKPAASDAPRKPVSLSIGGGAKPAASAADKAAEVPRKPVSISIGGAAKKPETDKAAPAPAAPAAVAAVKAIAAEEPSSTTVSAPSSRAESPAPAPAAEPKTEAKVASLSNKPVATERSATDADQILAEAAKVTDQETLKDLFGDKSDDLKSHLNIVFIGHVDAGKSTMGGNLLFLTGMVDKRTMEKYEREAKEAGRESWYLSWALDSTAQEREKGKTVEVGRAYFETGKRRYTILDAPGHKSFVPSMISGASQADVAVLVISARKGEFETGFERGGQTREHAVLVKTAGVQRLIVVVNKMDEPTVQWQQSRYDEIQAKLTPFLRSAGFNPKTDITYIPVSAYAGHNLKEKVSKDVCDWYNGPSLLEYLDNLELGDRKISAPLKMPISEKYNDMGTVVVGKLEAGKIKKGDTLLLMPNKVSVEAVSIFNEQEEEVPAAISGDNVRVKLKGVDHEEVTVGHVLTDPANPVHVATHFEAQLAILEHRNIICAGYSAVVHCHTVSQEANLAALLHYYDKKTGKKSRRGPQFAKKGMKIIALVELAGPICVERFKDYPQLGRFTLRDEGRTVAIGKVTKLITNPDDLPDVAKLSVTDAASAAAATN